MSTNPKRALVTETTAEVLSSLAPPTEPTALTAGFCCCPRENCCDTLASVRWRPCVANISCRRGNACSNAARVSACAALIETVAEPSCMEMRTSTGPMCSGVIFNEADCTPWWAIQVILSPTSSANPLAPTGVLIWVLAASRVAEL